MDMENVLENIDVNFICSRICIWTISLVVPLTIESSTINTFLFLNSALIAFNFVLQVSFFLLTRHYKCSTYYFKKTFSIFNSKLSCNLHSNGPKIRISITPSTSPNYCFLIVSTEIIPIFKQTVLQKSHSLLNLAWLNKHIQTQGE